jgi:hypothetical protein
MSNIFMIPHGISDEGLMNMAFHGRFGGGISGV